MLSLEKAKLILDKLIGEKCVDFLYAQHLTLVLYFGEIEKKEPLLTKWRLHIDCRWRVQNDSKVMFGSGDDDKRIVYNCKVLQNLSVEKVIIYPKTYDLDVHFEHDLVLNLFVDALDCEQWVLRHSDGHRLKLDEKLELVEYVDEPDDKG